ncbi:ATP-binding cassette domain-containing protein [Granulicatella sp. zg-ZJ]|uniref:ABC transporter ATP-binding protein n=1 Tax=Granulicatella sp. zg-ZJ TaxID=2678504 RepID=UPI0013D86B92|nr:ABC transporter ATP-binding protein [Granulicatella sp. zg-ZJ]NEW62305.1 ATP-binding cassette domain-containing protein [Granulicatella sp. zg-ZJ]NEW63169.1 ATP-binding cassette domain-containing protein [Granulicatella sp. zg-ZJ]
MIQVENVHVSFKQGQKIIPVLTGLDLQLSDKGIVTVVGKSGSGKTTLLKVASGLLAVDSGKVFIDSNDITCMDNEHRRVFCSKYIGFVWQDFKLIEEITVENNILLPIHIHKKQLDRAFYEQLINKLDIKHLIKKYPEQLSGGEKQRCAIARALITKPKILIADEPTGSLDVHTAENIIALFESSIKEFAELIIIVTHDPKLANIGDKKYEMVNGKVVMTE